MTLGQQNVRDYSTENDDSFDTVTIQAALDDCADEGSGVYLPPGTYRSTLLCVDNDATFRLANGIELRFVQGFTEFPAVESRWEGQGRDGFHPCLHVADVSDIAITSEGIIDGDDSYWRVFVSSPPKQHPSELTARLEGI